MRNGTKTLPSSWIVVFLLACLAAIVALPGCGGSGKRVEQPTIARIEPSTVTLRPGAIHQFTAFLNGNTYPELSWSVDNAPAGGTISQSGRYFAPSTPGTYTVRVVVSSNPSVTASATVIIDAGPQVQIEITQPTDTRIMSPRSTLDFTASVTGAANTGVTWTASAGTIDAGGKYTAPNNPGIYTITATSVADPTKSATRDVEVAANPSIVLEIQGKGTIVMQMNSDKAPITAGNLVSLTNAGFYDGIIFHRYEEDFVIQGGDPLTKTLPLDDPSIGTGGPGYTIPFERNDLLHEHYAVGMARGGDPDSGGSQFYICLKDLPGLDGSYVVFGRVVEGFSVVDALRRGDRITRATVRKSTTLGDRTKSGTP